MMSKEPDPATVSDQEVGRMIAALEEFDRAPNAGFRKQGFESESLRILQSRFESLLQHEGERLRTFHDSSMELALCVSEVFGVLALLREGNFQVRVSREVLNSSEELMAGLGQELNHTIEDFRERVETIQRMNLELTALKESLERKVHDRTLVLQETNQELRQTHRKLQENLDRLLISERNASLGRLTAGIAHEMNSPLAAVGLSLTEVEALLVEFERSVEDPSVTHQDLKEIATEMHGALRIAQHAADRVQQFVRGIRTQTRDLHPGERIAFDPATVIKEALLLLGHEIRRRKCDVRFEAAPGAFRIRGAPNHLAQIVTNLVNNSMDALAPESPRGIRITLDSSEPEIMLTVSDQGTGIPPAILSKIFDPLFTTKPYGEGTGLGLSIVHDLVKGQFGGVLQVASEVGMGTTFSIRFPRAEG
jgi:C4-dicarboxylate-specific signal transduction histidine kinase